MSASKTPVPSVEPYTSHDALLQQEAVGSVRRRRRRWLIAALAVVLVTAISLGARPALHTVKAWQARRLARQAMVLTEAGKLDEAHLKVQDALAIWRVDPEVAHAAAFFLTRAGAYRPALGYWQQLDTLRPFTAADLHDYAQTELGLGDLDAADKLLRRAWPEGTAGTRADWVLAMQIALRRGRAGEAGALATRLLQDATTPPRERLSACAVLASSNSATPEERALAWRNVTDLSRGNDTLESLSALVLLAQARVSSHGMPLPADAPTLPDLIARIDAHPLAGVQQHLMVLDLRLSQEPGRRAELIQEAVDRYEKTKESSDLAALTAWLYAKGEFDRVLGILPPARATGDRALYLQYLDTLAALSRWMDIRTSIQAHKFPLEPMFAQMFLARCAGQLGETEVCDARWQAALDAAGKDASKLVTLGQYAVKNGSLDVAAKAFEAAVHAAPDSRPAHEELVRFLESAGDTRRLRAAVAALSARWPTDPAALNDSAYLDALVNENVPAARNLARGLVRSQPGNIAFRTTLALCELRLHDGLAALEAVNHRETAEPLVLLPRQAAVRAAVLWEASFFPEAAATIKNIPKQRLLPEERELLRPIPGGDGP